MPRINPDRCAPGCDDQLPMISRVGRGIHGDDFRVEVASDSNCETILEGKSYDHATHEWTSEWLSENVNGGCLSYQYVLRPYTIPATFTITFVYRRPGRKEWSWTTPAIPYVWTIDEDGNKNPGDPDTMVGSGVATLFIKNTTDSEWREKLVYPDGTTRDDYNAPDPLDPWTVNLTFGVGGDIDVPNVDDIAKILGITVEQVRDIINGDEVTINGINADNIVDYVDKRGERVLDHVHEDLGFDDGFLPGDGGGTSVKEYIDKIGGQVTNVNTYLKNALQDIVNKFYGGGTIDDDGNVTWGASGKAAVGNMNIYAGGADSSAPNAIRTRADSTSNTNDVQVI